MGLRQWGPAFEIRFSFRLNSAVGSGCRNFIHLTSNDVDCCQSGTRLPAVFFCNNEYMHVGYANGENQKHHNHGPLETNKWYQVKMVQTVLGDNNARFTVQVDDEIVWQLDTNPNQYENVKMYQSDPWWPSLEDKVSVKSFTINRQGNANENSLEKPAEIAFVVDSSESMKEKDAWRQVKTWLEALVDAYKIDGTTRKGGLVVWSDKIHEKATIRFNDKKTAAELETAIKNLPSPDGWTNGQLALRYTYDNLFAVGSDPNVSREILFISGGESQTPLPQNPTQFHNNNIRITAVALGKFNTTEIKALLCKPCGDRLFLDEHMDQINSEAFLNQLVASDANSPCQDIGCNSLWGGKGECVDLFHNKWSSIESKYNVSVNPKEITDKMLCQPSNMAYKDPNRDCCRCFYKLDIPQPKCSDNGCAAKGGLCVNLWMPTLQSPTSFQGTKWIWTKG